MRTGTGNHAFTGVFLVGLGLIAWFNWWWPGIMFVIAMSLLASALVDGRLGENILAILILTVIGLIGVWSELHIDIGFPLWPAIFIVIGLAFLVRTFWRRE